MTNHLINRDQKLSEKEFINLREFILLNILPNDLRLSMAHDLVNSKKPDLKRLYAVPEIGKLLLSKM